MLYWYADDSGFTSSAKLGTATNVHLFGGIVVEHSKLSQLLKVFEDKKEELTGNKRYPLKWNLRDLEKDYKAIGAEKIYIKILENYNNIRLEIFRVICRLDFSIIVSFLEAYSVKEAVLKKQKDELIAYAFVMGLMRFGLEVKSKKPLAAKVILDWPHKSGEDVYNDEYRHLYNIGKSKAGQHAKCGALHTLNFYDSVFYTKTMHSSVLQLVDLTIGATKEYMQSLCKPKKKTTFIRDCFSLIEPKYRDYPNHMNRGIVIPSNADLNKLYAADLISRGL